MRNLKFLIFIFLLFFLISIGGTREIFSQQFGQNKVQYKEFHWKYLKTKHFDIYFYQGGEKLAQFTAHTSEHALKNLSENLDYNITQRIPIIVYNSHNDFQQNNVIDEFLPEGVGGVTELYKNRVNIPFEGNYEAFRHVIHHELLHAFMNEMYYGGSIQNIISQNISVQFPLWFSEGMAEIQSLYGLNKATDMYMRDATINNYVPPLEYIGGYFAYRGGQSFFAFLADTYGEDKLGILMNNIKTFGDVYQGFKETYKFDLEQLNTKWQLYLKKMYWPDLKIREDVSDFSKQLTDHERDGGYYNVAPKISPDGTKFAFISNQDDLFDVYIAKTKNGEIIKKVIAGNNNTDFEELKILTPGLCWSPNGRKLAISVKSGDKDVIYLIDIESGDKEELPLKFNSINSVNWSPVNNKLAFIGDKGDRSNLYVFDYDTKKLETMTDDIFTDGMPTWDWDGKRIFFTSDRGAYTDPAKIPKDIKMWEYDYSNSDYYSIDVKTKEIIRMSDTKDSKESYAQVSSDGKKILFLSDVCGITNIYLRETDSAGSINIRPITNALNPIDQLSLSRDGKKLLFTSLNKGAYDIYSLDDPFKRDIGLKELVLTDFQINENKYPNKFGREEGLPPLDSNSALNDSLKKSGDTVKVTMSDSVNNSNNDTNADTNMFSPELSEIAPGDSLMSSETDSLKISSADSVKNILPKTEKDSAKYYGDDVKISFDLPKVEKADNKDSSYAQNQNFKLSDNTNPDGSFKINNYKIKFSPDLVYGTATYTSFYGVQGIAQVLLSDMLGDHKILIQTSLVIDLKNSDYAIAYYYLPKRIDYGFSLYHTARFVTYNSGFFSNLYRYTTIGGSVSASYPFSRFKRIEGRAQLEVVSQENLDVTTVPVIKKTLLVPTLSFIHDNTTWGYYSAPVSGTRYNLTLFGSPKLGSEGIGFGSFLFDFRHYFKMGDFYSFVTRLSGGVSEGPNPQRFFIGGVPNWINSTYENYNIPIYNIGDFSFSSPGMPLRGYNYDRLAGTRYSIVNLELRFPLFQYLVFGALPLGFANIEGVMFLDMGTAWSDDNSFRLFTQNQFGKLMTQDLLAGTGVGARINFLGQPVMFDVAWGYNIDKFTKPIYYISFGYDF